MTTTAEAGDNGVFWGEISPCEHMLQIYDRDSTFLDTLEGFVVGGIRAGDAIIIIALPEHLRSLEERMKAQWIDIDAVRETDQYIALDARETLSKFMIKGSSGRVWPDSVAFEELVTELIDRARGDAGRPVRAFGEMVAILWEEGSTAATVHLEHLWHHFCQKYAFCLFCAYPRIGFTENAEAAIKELCAAHSRVLAEPAGR